MSNEVDGWIAQLMQCKPLSETEVKKLCDKVRVLARGGNGGCLVDPELGPKALRCVLRV